MHEEKHVRCPFLNNRCMGDMCAMAVYSFTWGTWRCGLANANITNFETANVISFEKLKGKSKEDE